MFDAIDAAEAWFGLEIAVGDVFAEVASEVGLVLNDAVVEVDEVEGAVGAVEEVDGAESFIGRGEEFAFLERVASS